MYIFVLEREDGVWRHEPKLRKNHVYQTLLLNVYRLFRSDHWSGLIHPWNCILARSNPSGNFQNPNVLATNRYFPSVGFLR